MSKPETLNPKLETLNSKQGEAAREELRDYMTALMGKTPRAARSHSVVGQEGEEENGGVSW